ADVAAVPARIDDAAEEDPERDETEPPELWMLPAPRLRGPLLDPRRRLGTQLSAALLPRHGGAFAAPSGVPLTRDGDRHPVVRGRVVGEELRSALDRALQDEELPQRVRLRRVDEAGQRPEVERTLGEQPDEQVVVLPRSGIEAVRAVRVVSVRVVG